MAEQTIIQGDCLEVIPHTKFDLVLTDPPYPDYHQEQYAYRDGAIDFLRDIHCRQLIFWSAKTDFPLDYTAIHIWHKPNGAACQYERIFERNGGKRYRVFRGLRIQSIVSAQMARDVFTGHPSQKPLNLIKELISLYSKPDDTILDPFMGSGTTLVAAKELNRNAVGIELNPTYCEMASKRLSQKAMQFA